MTCQLGGAISAFVAQQSLGMIQINQGVREMTSAAEQSQVATAGTKRTVEDLNQLAGRLTALTSDGLGA